MIVLASFLLAWPALVAVAAIRWSEWDNRRWFSETGQCRICRDSQLVPFDHE